MSNPNSPIIGTLLAAIAGAFIAGVAMVVNSFVSNKLDQQKEDQIQKRKQKIKDIEEAGKLYRRNFTLRE